ncbi:PTS transporter subunit EIIC [Spiroplasma cantharicola]|uniref:PTS system, sucrose-specific IIC component n=1 Tax=Spiroplasma cantharicola TaxID=362837 RepID=A0A0M4KCR4_9MOLU|nr:PTS transporter subunit EIIC [Spiroplasma cantharicola]ALD66565.1 PTS system, sucrose-specific IIC component [Spiroplasma cantharicola]
MSKEERSIVLIQNIFDKIGGGENIKDVYHCATRMRLTLFNPQIVDLKEIKKIVNIKGALWSNGELQLIIGQEVSKVTSILKNQLNNFKTNNTDNFKIKQQENLNNFSLWKRLIKSVSAIFGPLIPFLVGVGLIMALQQFLLRTGLVNDPTIESAIIGQDYNVFDVILNAIASTGFKMMGVIAIWSTVRYLGGKPAIAIALGLLMITPIIPESGIELFKLGTWNISIKPFYSTILVFIVMGIIIAYFQKLMEKHFNPVADFILNPFLILLLGGLLAFFIMGPIMGVIENLLLNVFNWFMNLPIGLGAMVVGLTWQPLVVLGVHNILFFAAIADLQKGNPSLFLAAAFAAAWAQMGATIAVGLKSKKTIDKSACFAAALPGIISGPTESCIYGVNLPKGLPFITGTLAGAIGGWVIGIFQVKLDNLAGLGGIVGFLAYTNSLALAILIDLFAFGLGIAFTFFFWKEEKSEKVLALKTTKKFSKEKFLNQEIDFSAKNLIYYFNKLNQKKIKDAELIEAIKQAKVKLIKVDLQLENKVNQFIKDLENEKYNSKNKKNIISLLKNIKSDRQKILRNYYRDLLVNVKNLNTLNFFSKKIYNLIIKNKNLKYKLDKLIIIEEKNQADLFNKKGMKDSNLEINLVKKSKLENKIKKLEIEITEVENKIKESSLILISKKNEHYLLIDKKISEMEIIMNEDFNFYRNKYYYDIYDLEIKENLIQIKRV